MYGPVATRYCEPYVVGECLSSGPANDFGTGAESGRLSAWIRNVAPGLVMWKTIVVEFGVWMPGVGVTARLTGGLKSTFGRMWTVRVLPPSVIPPLAVVGITVAKSGLTVWVLFGR